MTKPTPCPTCSGPLKDAKQHAPQECSRELNVRLLRVESVTTGLINNLAECRREKASAR